MKRLGLLMILILSVAFATGVQAQASFGIKAGLSMAKVKGDNTDGVDTKTGFMIGGFGAIPLSESSSLQPELFYVQKGAKSSAEGVDMTLKLDYIEIPVLFKYTVAGESAKPYFLLGPSLGFKASASLEGDEDALDLDRVTSTDWGLVFGLGMNMQKFLIEFRYTLGLSNVYDDDANDASFKNSAFGLLVGYNF